ncbi:MAG: hypothetical protein GX442_23665 [Candidatus Riflebacteria bacterium]|nr:hypothetical protein [Candidatus Riflebacteria bacterium]
MTLNESRLQMLEEKAMPLTDQLADHLIALSGDEPDHQGLRVAAGMANRLAGVVGALATVRPADVQTADEGHPPFRNVPALSALDWITPKKDSDLLRSLVEESLEIVSDLWTHAVQRGHESIGDLGRAKAMLGAANRLTLLLQNILFQASRASIGDPAGEGDEE